MNYAQFMECATGLPDTDNTSVVIPSLGDALQTCREHCLNQHRFALLNMASSTCRCGNEEVLAKLDTNATSTCTGNDEWSVISTSGIKKEHAYELSVEVVQLQTRPYVKPMETVLIKITPNYNVRTRYRVTFGDETGTVVTADSPVSHYWGQAGTYTITVTTEIGIVEFSATVSFQVQDIDEGRKPERVQLFASEPPEPMSGVFYSFVADNTSTAQCKVSATPGTQQNMTVTNYVMNSNFKHTYATFGEYLAELSCENNYGSVNTSLYYLSKMEDIPFAYISTEQSFTIQITGKQSFISGLDVVRNFETHPMNVEKDLMTKEVTVANTTLQPFENLVSFQSEKEDFHQRIFFVEHVPTTASIIPDHRQGDWNLTTNITIKVPPGNHIFVQMSFGLGEEELFYIYEAHSPVDLVFEVSYEAIGYYPVKASVSNDLGRTEVEDLISIEVPIDDMVLFVNNITDKTKPVELIVDMNIGAAGPEKMTFEIDHGDGVKRNYTYRSWTEEFTTYVNEYMYEDWGIYTICVKAFSEIDEISDCALVQVGQNISYIDVKSTNALRTTTSLYADFNITYINGTDKTYSVDFGDGTVFTFKDLDMLNNSVAKSQRVLGESDFKTDAPRLTTTVRTIISDLEDDSGNITGAGSNMTTTMIEFTTESSVVENELNVTVDDNTGGNIAGTTLRRRRKRSAVGLPQSTAVFYSSTQDVVTIRHIYTHEGYYKVKSNITNVFSYSEASLCQMIMVDNTDDSICGQTVVSFINMTKDNAKSPITRVRSQPINIDVLAISNCAINSGFKYSWSAVEMMDDRQRPVGSVCDVEFTESLYTVPPVTLHFATYKFTVTAAPIGYKRKATQAEIYVQVVPSNPIATFFGEETETLFSDGFVTFDFSQSHDPDLISNSRLGVEFDLVCFQESDYKNDGITVLDTFMEGNVTRVMYDDIMYIESTQNPFRLHDYHDCFNDINDALADITVTDGTVTVDTKHFRSTTTIFSLVVSKEGRSSETKKIIRMVYGNFEEQFDLLLNAKELKDTNKALDIVNKIGTGSSVRCTYSTCIYFQNHEAV